MRTEARVEIVSSLACVEAEDWNRLAGSQPFLRHAYLYGLEQAGCVGGASGWAPCHVLLYRSGELIGALPLYLKHHSYGEYVFDWAWAEAYGRHGLAYYPKLLTAVPFTPVQGRRLLAQGEDRLLLIDAARALARDHGCSSWHCLFPTAEETTFLAQQGLLLRHGVQFHWRNAGYADFDAFLATLSHDKRKKIKQERRRVREAGVRFEHRVGSAITDADWGFFESCYRATYAAHHAAPYLNLAFFRHLGATLGEHCLMVLGERNGAPLCAALNLFDATHLYGRYWGARAFVPGLHFETCYYQAIEFAIARGLEVFEGGAQGEHKLARGLMPVTTTSAHWLAHPEFARALAQYLERESAGVAHYLGELSESSPFKRT